ncbi:MULTISPECIES: GNAT family N-acetyltransferase [Kitasatospora]|uniref:Putative acetyltransferase n=1 Tax=Kitasatospora setae (strain ATCC 33774 / DSM 43861 / JCM 3304 / KCC A-0304 / NBRC 14216 / KM-6054) TaxID=452652 RepID=E4NGD7_KITSK|nr:MULTISPECIES: GNAT family N-acetyltransferase [Kitasatospora]BAJ30567.1 putative acetyltransferase [Kitasatospora setae KM-6054]
MSTPRPAVPADAEQLVELRALMFEAMRGEAAPGPWQRTAADLLTRRLAEPERRLQAYVTDDPEHPGRLTSCAVGTLEQRLPAPGHPDGLFGFVFNVCTRPEHRGRGLARACTGALLGWFDAAGATRVDLHATADGQALYRGLGFHEHSTPLSRNRPAAG